MKQSQPLSLRKHVPRQVLHWGLMGMLLSSMVTLFVVTYLGIASTREQLSTIAHAASTAFRPMIISGSVKNAELQMREAFSLRDGESIVVLDPTLKRYYNMGREEQNDGAPSCQEPHKVCWNPAQASASTMVPLYFGSDEKELFGYVQVTLRPRVNFQLLWLVCALILFGSLFQAAGLSAKLIQLNSTIGDRLNLWATLLQKDPRSRIPVDEVPFSELEPMRSALSSLHEEVARLEKEAGRAASLAVIRGIAHDILSPVSQLRKLTAVLERSKDQPEEFRRELMAEIDRALRRLSYIANQTKLIQQGSEPAEPLRPSDVICDMTRELAALTEELRSDPDVMEKELTVELKADAAIPVAGTVIPGDYQRIMDNLIRNAVQASPVRGKIELVLSQDEGRPRVSIRDNGPGIPDNIRERIFDLDFSTKPGLGTGLGLAIVRQLCVKNNAKVAFNTQVGKGTEFQVTFQPAQSGVAV